MLVWCRLAAVLVIASHGGKAQAGSCPAPLREATQLVLVVAPSMDSPEASLRMFERETSAASWRAKSDSEPAVVGLKGLAWGFAFRAAAEDGEPVKVEGDKRAPAGFYRLGPSFGFEPAARPNHIRLETDAHYCVDDVRSPHYSRIVSREVAGPGTSGEKMREIPLYRRGIVVDYPTDREAKAGSCIFVHVWRGEGQGTTGCVALPEPSVARLQNWSRNGDAVIALLPEAALGRFESCLPQLAR